MGADILKNLTPVQREFVDMVLKEARKNLANDGRLMPVAFVMDDGNDVNMLGLDFSTEAKQRVSLGVVALAAAECRSEMFMVLAEGRGNTIDERTGKQQSAPVDVVSVVVVRPSIAIAGIAVIEKGKGRSKKTFGEMQWDEAQSGGGIVELLRSHAAQRTAATLVRPGDGLLH